MILGQKIWFAVCNQKTQVARLGSCQNCDTDLNFGVTTSASCNGNSKQRFFPFSVTPDLSLTDTAIFFHGILTLQSFDINTNQIPFLQTWLEANTILTPNLALFSPMIVFQSIQSNRLPSPDLTI